MEERERADLNINGLGSASGGDFRHVNIEGVGRVDGDLSCESFRLNGMGTVKGTIHTAGLFDMNGKLTGYGEIEASKVLMNGHASLHGRLRGEVVELIGIVKVHGDCEAERFIGDGGFTIGGLLNAGTVDIQLYGRTQIGEIGGDRISVRKSERKDWSRLLAWVVPIFQTQLRASAIEGDAVELEMTTAGIVRGNRVVIGPGCKIGRVEYRDELIVHPNAEIGEQARQ